MSVTRSEINESSVNSLEVDEQRCALAAHNVNKIEYLSMEYCNLLSDLDKYFGSRIIKS